MAGVMVQCFAAKRMHPRAVVCTPCGDECTPLGCRVAPQGKQKCTPPKSEMHPIYGTLLNLHIVPKKEEAVWPPLFWAHRKAGLEELNAMQTSPFWHTRHLQHKTQDTKLSLVLLFKTVVELFDNP